MTPTQPSPQLQRQWYRMIAPSGEIHFREFVNGKMVKTGIPLEDYRGWQVEPVTIMTEAERQQDKAKLAQLEAELKQARQTISVAQLRIGHYSTIVKELTNKIDFDRKSLKEYTDLHGHGDDDDSTTT